MTERVGGAAVEQYIVRGRVFHRDSAGNLLAIPAGTVIEVEMTDSGDECILRWEEVPGQLIQHRIPLLLWSKYVRLEVDERASK